LGCHAGRIAEGIQAGAAGSAKWVKGGEK
jgi:hypothetical protein